jgi:hypothetical protein
MPDWWIVLRDVGLIALAASAYVMTLLRLKPRAFLRHYPSEIRRVVPPLTTRERRYGALAGLPLMALIVGGPLASSLAFHKTQAGMHATTMFWQTFAVAMVFNVVDLLGLDYFWLGVLRPRWAQMPGAEGVAYSFNWLQHLRGFVVGTVLAALIAAVAVLILRRA